MGVQKDDKKKDGGEKKLEDAGGAKKAVAGSLNVVLKVDLHYEVKKSIRHFEGVESVNADIAGNKLTVTGKVGPTSLKERVEHKTRKKVELISPQPKKDDKKTDDKPSEKKSDEKKGGDKPSEKKSDDKKAGDKPSEKKSGNKKSGDKPSEKKSDDKKADAKTPKEVMPAKIVKAIKKAEAELNDIGEKWTKASAKRDAIREAMNEKHKQVEKLTEEIQKYDVRYKELIRNMPYFKEMWSTK